MNNSNTKVSAIGPLDLGAGVNRLLAQGVVEAAWASGVREFCVCPGARNSPLIALLSSLLKAGGAPSLRLFWFYEERSAAFFALGRIRASNRPVAVVTTSGTAVGELLPATMEAYYAGLPLVLITADRPRRYRGSGSPQTAEQVGIFGIYAPLSLDFAELDFAFNFGKDEKPVFSLEKFKPSHINVCFEEPLLEFESSGAFPSLFKLEDHAESPSQTLLWDADLALAQDAELTGFFKNTRFPLVIVGGLHPSEKESVAQWLMRLNVPAYFEGLSGLREDPRMNAFKIYNGDLLMQRGIGAQYPIDAVIRIGGVPTLRFWRDLEFDHLSVPVLSISSLPFSGLGRQSIVRTLHVMSEVSRLEKCQSADLFLEQDRKAFHNLQKLLLSEPLSEPGMIAFLSSQIGKGARIYLGNSLPIREWDLAAVNEDRGFQVWGSRGLNGIDGQVSTFLGYAQKNTENWALIGDLTALYDLPGPWILNQMPELRVNLGIINNGGGKIFSRIFTQKEFQNCHQIEFSSWASLWGMKYEKWESIPERIGDSNSSRMIEILPHDDATDRFWKAYPRCFD